MGGCAEHYHGASHTNDDASELARMAADLQSLIQQFKMDRQGSGKQAEHHNEAHMLADISADRQSMAMYA
jgi:hypothetical protein